MTAVTTSPRASNSLTQPFRKLVSKLAHYIRDNYDTLITNPRLFLLVKAGRFEIVRSLVSMFYKPSKAYEITKENPSVIENINVGLAVETIEKDCCYPGLNLPQDVQQEILEFAHSSTCYANRDPMLKFKYAEREQLEAKVGQKIRIGSYLGDINFCPAIKRLQSDPGILAIAAKYLGADPVHTATELWWSFPVPPNPLQQLKSAQVFHYDLDDYRFIKFFFYLTDVDLTSGPHVFIRGTHKNKKFIHQVLGLRCAGKTEEELTKAYGAENLVTLCGPAGFGFAEDALSFHRGSPPTAKERLLLQIEFSVTTYGDLRASNSKYGKPI